LPIVDYETFVGEQDCFLVYGGERWLTRALEADGAMLEVRGENEGQFLFIATTARIPAPRAASKAAQR
jgi:hypothetical protein